MAVAAWLVVGSVTGGGDGGGGALPGAPAPGRSGRSGAALLRSPGFRRLLAAQTVSPLGDAMATTALILHLQRTTGTATAVGLMLFVQAIPPLAAPLAGVVADRVRPRVLLAGAALLQAGGTGVLALWLPSMAPLLALVFLLSLVDTPLGAAVGRTIPAVVDDRHLPAANAVRGGARELGTVLGPPLAGLLYVAAGPRWVLAVDAVTFLLTVPLVLRLPDPPAEPRGGTTVGADAVAGMAVVWRTPVVRAVAIGFWLAVLLSASDDLSLPFLVTDELGGGPVAVGVLLAAAAVGLLVGLPLVGPVGRRVAATAAIVGGLAVMGLGNLLTAAAPWLVAAFAAQLVRGLALPLLDGFVATVVQRSVPPGLLGRAIANVYGGVSVAAAVGLLAGGPLIDATSPRVALLLAGTGAAGGACLTAALLRDVDVPARLTRRRRTSAGRR